MEGIKRAEESSISWNRYFIILAINLIYTQPSSFQKLCKVLTLPQQASRTNLQRNRKWPIMMGGGGSPDALGLQVTQGGVT